MSIGLDWGRGQVLNVGKGVRRFGDTPTALAAASRFRCHVHAPSLSGSQILRSQCVSSFMHASPKCLCSPPSSLIPRFAVSRCPNNIEDAFSLLQSLLGTPRIVDP